jgi:hypothetical protein
VLVVLGLLPVGSWVAGAGSDPLYDALWREWASGSAIAVGVGFAIALLTRRAPSAWGAGVARRLARILDVPPRTFVLLTATIATGLALALAVILFNGRPILVDEIAQVRQAQIFAQGHLWLPIASPTEFVSSLLMVDVGHRLYSQFPPGGPAMIALGQLVGAPWIVNPIASGISVLAFGVIARAAEPRRRVAAAAVVLFAFAPFVLFMSASHMNHVTVTMWLLVASAALITVMADARPRPAVALASGLAFGIAATIRPTDALAFAVPAAIWYVARASSDRRRWLDAFAAAVGVGAPLAAMMIVNAHTTGAPLRFGYQVLWGDWHTIGFHQAPWGEAHTPARGLSYINHYLLQLERYLFETPIPALLPAIGALALAPRLRAVDRYLLTGSALLLLIYFAYFHEGYYLGPRFVFPLAPVLVLWTARFPAYARDQSGSASMAYRTAVYTLVVSAIMAVAIDIPVRATSYARSATTERWASPRRAAQAGVRQALVFVREPWESQLGARLWALNVSRPETERLLTHVDACRLERSIDRLEHDRDAATTAVRAPLAGTLDSLLRDSALVHRQQLAPGLVVHMQQGYVPAPLCLERVQETLRGVTPLAPFLDLDDGNIYVRDLHERDTLILAAYPNRPVYVLHSAGVEPNAEPRYYRDQRPGTSSQTPETSSLERARMPISEP